MDEVFLHVLQQIRIFNFDTPRTIPVTHQCYYCNGVFESRDDLYEHVVIHANTRSENSQKTSNDVIKPIPETRKKAKTKNEQKLSQTDTDSLNKKIVELQKRIESHLK